MFLPHIVGKDETSLWKWQSTRVLPAPNEPFTRVVDTLGNGHRHPGGAVHINVPVGVLVAVLREVEEYPIPIAMPFDHEPVEA